MISTLLVILAAAPGLEETRVSAGEVRDEILSAGQQRFAFVPASAGTFTASIESYDFALRLAVVRADGTVVDEGSDDLRPARAWVEVAAEVGEPLEIVVTSDERPTGRFHLSLFERSADADRVFDTAREAVGEERHREALDLLDEALALVLEVDEEVRDRRLEGNVQIWRGNALLVLGRVDESLAAQSDAGDVFRTLGDARKELVVVGNLGNVQERNGRFEASLASHERALQLARATDDTEAEAGAHNNLGAALRSLDRGAEACDQFQLARGLYRSIGDVSNEIVATINYGQALMDLRAYDEAQRELEHGARLANELGRQGLAATAHNALGSLHRARGALDEAESAFETALALGERVGDANIQQWALAQLASTYTDRADLPAAREAWAARLAINERLGNPYIEAWTRCGLGRVAVRAGDLVGGEEHLSAALEFAQDAGDRYLEARCEVDLASLWTARGEAGQAVDRASNAVVIQSSRGDRHEEADALVTLADAHLARGEDEEAARVLDRAATLYDGLGLEPGALAVRRRRSKLLRNAGDLEGARELLRTVLSGARAEGDRYLEALVALDLAVIEHDCGAFAVSSALAAHAFDVARATGAVGVQVDALYRVSDTSFHLGDFAGADDAAQRRARLARDLGRPSLEASARLHAAAALMARGDSDSARAELVDALALVPDESSRTRARILGRLGSIELARGDRSGLTRLEQRVSIVEGAPFEEAQARSALASALYHQLGDSERARAEAEKAVRLFDAIGRPSWSVAAYSVLASSALDEGEARPAIEGLRRANDVLTGPWVQHLDASTATSFRSHYAHWGRIAQDLTALRLRGAGDAAARAEATLAGLAAAGRWKARVLLEGIAEHRSGGRTAEAIEIRRRRREALALREDVLDALAAAHAARATRAELDKLAARERGYAELARGLDAQLTVVSALDAALERPEDTDVARLQAEVLDGRTALIELVEGRSTLAAYVVTPTHVERVELTSRDEANALVDAVLETIASHERRAPLDEVVDAGRRAFRALLAPALEALAGASTDRLIVVPCESVARLPFAALVLDAPDAPASFADVTFVLDRYQISYAPAAPVLLELTELGPRGPGGRVMILADPTYPSEGPAQAPSTAAQAPALPAILGGAIAARAAPSPDALVRLTETRREAVTLARLLTRYEDQPGLADDLLALEAERSGSIEAGLFELHLGEDAGPQQLSGDLREFAVLHFAAHGFVDPETPQRTGLALAFRGDDPGWFAIEDALQLDLDANLVVLSACETARGSIVAGEGVQSLARAFLYAGARGVVASLWPVADEATARTMETFYAGLLEEGLSPAAALTKAQRFIRSAQDVRGVGLGGDENAASGDAGHPYFWAPFVLVGLPR